MHSIETTQQAVIVINTISGSFWMGELINVMISSLILAHTGISALSLSSCLEATFS